MNAVIIPISKLSKLRHGAVSHVNQLGSGTTGTGIQAESVLLGVT